MTKAEFQQKEEDFFDKWWIELNEEDKVYCYMDLNYVELDGNGWPKIDIPVKELNEWWNRLKTRDKACLCKEYMIYSDELVDEDED